LPLLADGKALRDIAQIEGMPHQATILRWVENDAGARFREQYARARNHFYDRMAEECVRIADDAGQDFFVEDRNGKSVVVPDLARVQRDRLRVDARKWFLSKRDSKRYGDRLEIEAGDGPIQVTWLQSDAAPPIAPEPQRLIEYKRPSLPCDLTDADWSVMLQVLESIKRVIPSNSDSPPAEVFEVIRKALLTHYAEDEPVKRIVLPRRGRSGTSKK
jgi:hypothetical protein